MAAPLRLPLSPRQADALTAGLAELLRDHVTRGSLGLDNVEALREVAAKLDTLKGA